MLGNYANSHWFTSLDHVGLALFIKELMDTVEFESTDEGTTVTMTKTKQ